MSKCVFDKSTVNEQLVILTNLLEEQRQIKKTLLSYLEKVSDHISNNNTTDNTEVLVSCLNSVQEIFDNIKYNIDKIVELKLFLENISKSNSLNVIDFEKYNNQFIELSKEIEKNNISYHTFMQKLTSISYIDFSNLEYTHINATNSIEENIIPEAEITEDAAPVIEENIIPETEITEDAAPVIEENIIPEAEITEDAAPVIEENIIPEAEITEDAAPVIEENIVPEAEITEDAAPVIEENIIPEAEITEDIAPVIEENIVPEAEITEDVAASIEENVENFSEKTLFINDKEQIAILPYSLLELEEYFSNNPEKYSSIDDIIEKEYTISLNDYENTSISRFKQTFKLAKEKSNLSFFESLNYANKLFFEEQIEPVIIAACTNIKELEAYLDCLNNNVLNEFDYFTIVRK